MDPLKTNNLQRLKMILEQTDVALIHMISMNFWITTKEPWNPNFYEDCAQGILYLSKVRQKKVAEILKKGSF